METRTRMVKAIGSAVAVAGLFVMTSAKMDAGSATSNLSVSATVINNCTISTGAMAFGNYDPVSVNASTGLSGTGTVTVACTKGATVTIGLGLGANASGSQRRLTDGSNFLDYDVYKEVGHSNVWGTSGSATVNPYGGSNNAPNKNAVNTTAYGLVTANQDVPAGSYTDTVVATVNF